MGSIIGGLTPTNSHRKNLLVISKRWPRHNRIKTILPCFREKWGARHGLLSSLNRMTKMVTQSSITIGRQPRVARIPLLLVNMLKINSTNYLSRRSQIDHKVRVQARNSLDGNRIWKSYLSAIGRVWMSRIKLTLNQVKLPRSAR